MAKVAYEILENGDKKRVFAEDEAKLGRKLYSQKKYVCCGKVNSNECLCEVKIVAGDSKRIHPYFKPKNKKIKHIPDCPNYEFDDKTDVKRINFSSDAYGDMLYFLDKFCSNSEKSTEPKDGGTGYTGGTETEIDTPEKYSIKDIEIKDKKLKNAKDIYEFFRANVLGNIPYNGHEVPAKDFIFNRDTFGDFKRRVSTFDGYCVVFAKKGVPTEEFKDKYYDFNKPIYHLFDMYSDDIKDCKYSRIAFQLVFSSKKLFDDIKDKYFFNEKYKHFIIVGDCTIVDNNESSEYLVCKCNITHKKQIVPATEDIIAYEK